MTCALYRHFDADGQLLYVGITSEPARRLVEHVKASKWDISSVNVQWFDTRVEAVKEERRLIKEQNPPHNIRKDDCDVPVAPTVGWRGALSRAVHESGISMRAISKRAGLGSGYVHSILMAGKDPTVENFLSICAVLNLSPSVVLDAAILPPARPRNDPSPHTKGGT